VRQLGTKNGNGSQRVILRKSAPSEKMRNIVLDFDQKDSKFLANLRAVAIFVIVFGHVGGFWIFGPASKFLLVFLSLFFFISGVVTFVSIQKRPSLFRWTIRRFLSLYIPYILFCIIPLAVYIFSHHSLPLLSKKALISWLKMYPSSAYMPYPLGHLWFIQTLMIISIFLAPLMFLLFIRNKLLIYFSFLAIFVLSFFSFTDPHSDIAFFSYWGINLYKPLTYSLFYIIGWLYLTDRKLFYSNRLLFLGILFFIFLVFLSLKIYHSPYFEGHIHPPDVYFIAGSILFILLLSRVQSFINFLFSFPVFKSFSIFFFNHTYSIYLLHTFAIFLSETVFAFLLPSNKNLIYGIIKLNIVLIITCLLAVIFDQFSKKATKYVLNKLHLC